ncbi:MAG: response regulator transcription factor [Chitinophagaceae bacterium]|jgi:DNA-binding NarL/FixJ family response regulator|nr:response regulator transcription factor [Chitinophagaceae bacterium]
MRVAIFEDNKKYRESLEFVIVTSGDFELCGSFSDTKNLLQRIEALQPHVVLMDINLPGINGIESVRQIKQAFPQVQVCMQTVFDDDDKIFASLCNGASGYVLKTAPPDELVRAIKDVASGGSFFTPSVARRVLAHFQAQPVQDAFIQLTAREKEILKWLVEGLSYKEMANRLNISFHTIHTHLRNIYEKMHVSGKGEAISKAMRNKLV